MYGLRIALGFVGGYPGRCYSTGVAGLREAGEGCCGIPAIAEIHVDDLPMFINRTREVAPVTSDLKVGFIHAPPPIDRRTVLVYRRDAAEGEGTHPSVDGARIDGDPPFGQPRGYVRIAQAIAEIPADGKRSPHQGTGTHGRRSQNGLFVVDHTPGSSRVGVPAGPARPSPSGCPTARPHIDHTAPSPPISRIGLPCTVLSTTQPNPMVSALRHARGSYVQQIHRTTAVPSMSQQKHFRAYGKKRADEPYAHQAYTRRSR